MIMLKAQIFRPFDENSPQKALMQKLRHPIFQLLGLRGVIAEHSPSEEALLKRYATGAKVSVEIGVAEGASAHAIRESLHPEGILYLIDPYISGRIPFLNATKWVAHRFVNQVSNASVIWIADYSSRVAEDWNKQIDFLFIDGDHSYERCLQDWEQWSPYISNKGYVAFHDARTFHNGWTTCNDGPVRVVNTIFNGETISLPWHIVDEIDSLIVIQKNLSCEV